jgi:hypothetical protein
MVLLSLNVDVGYIIALHNRLINQKCAAHDLTTPVNMVRLNQILTAHAVGIYLD